MPADSKLRIVILYTVQASYTLSTTLRAFVVICCLVVGEYILDLSYRAEVAAPALGQ